MRVRGRHRSRGAACLLCLGLGIAAPAAAQPAGACTLLLTEHRTARPLLQTAWPARELRVSFMHSVLGTPVEDRYVWRDAGWRLVEERFEGQGYGLPHEAAAGERLIHEGGRSRLMLDRSVMPLVVRPLRAQQMRLTLRDGRTWLLADMSGQAIEFNARDC